ncbi:FAD-binding protein [Cellulomonas sp. zg-ZUI188]|uniref:FAD-binding protein n=2 Tax=Cellulomonas fengjieae TaxID=2819978 RepID=A0ABS3SHC7_9CELL|nr:FAD-binding protein [Cellulomonas fengjieae]QVI66269.1 FAD-binding protein [Cellulomonas fengjieae]
MGVADMELELGIAVDAGPDAGPLAQRAEAAGLDLVVVREGAARLDPWTTAAWVAGSTGRIPVGVSHGPAGPAGYPAVVAKARQSLDVLSGPRLIDAEPGWVVAPAGAHVAELRDLARTGLPVVVPVTAVEDVDRVAALAGDRSGGPRRSAAARSRRRDGIDYDGVPETLRDTAVEPGDRGYRAVSSNYLRGGAPGLVLRPRTPEQVADAVAFARHHPHVPLGVRSGGHGISGRSTNDGGLVIDVGAMSSIEVLDVDRRLVRIGPGATWKQVAAALDPYGWALGSGDYGGVGVGGLATAGGIGYLSRAHGLTVDHLRAVELVLADGSLVRAAAHERPDLFWAVRGAGANFGIATAFEFEVDEVGDVGYAILALVTPDIEASLLRFGELATQAPRDTTVFLVTGRPRHGQSVIQLYAMVDSSDADVIVGRLTPFLELGDLAQQEVAVTRYAGVMARAHDVGPDGHQGTGEPVSRSAFAPRMTPELAHDLGELLRTGRVFFLQLRTMGGAIADVPSAETAFAHRSPDFQLTAMGTEHASLDPAFDRLAHHFDGLYLSFETDLRPERLADAFPPLVLSRLRDAKRRYDPDNLFRDNFTVDPLGGRPKESS